MQFTRLTIENLRAVAHLDVNLSVAGGIPRRRVIFLGANGADKTTILDALAHAFQKLLPTASELGATVLGAGDIRNVKDADLGSERPTRRALIRMEATLSDNERRSIRPYFPDAPTRGSLSFIVGNDEISDLLLKAALPDARTMKRVGGAPQDSTREEIEAAALKFNLAFPEAANAALLSARPPCLLLPADRGVLLDGRGDLTIKQITDFDPRRGCLSRSRDRFAPLASRLALAFSGGKRNDRSSSIARMWKVLEKYFPEMPRPVDVDGLLLQFENGDGSIVPLSALSDGERAIMLIFGEIALRTPEDGVILIDEIEQHLHPRWQHAILEGLVSLVPSAQFILTTQSPYVAACAPNDVLEVGDWKRDG